MAEYTFDIKTDAPASFSSIPEQNKDASIVRLVEDPNIVKTIKFDEMRLDVSEYAHNPMQGGDKMTDDMGLAFPAIRINDMMIPRKALQKMNISMSDFVPSISLVLKFEDRSFISKNMPKDGDIISLFLRSTTNALTYLRDDFIIMSVSTNNGTTNDNGVTVKIGGRLFIPGFDSRNKTTAYVGTSRDVMRQISKHYGIGFAFNDYDDTDDYQNWIQCMESTESFINSVTSHSWKNNTSFFKTWIDLYYNLCYVNINKFLMSDENEETVDLTFATNALNMYNLQSPEQDVNQAKVTIKLLSNSPQFVGSPFYVKKWTPFNTSTGVSMSVGYSTNVYSFIHNQELLEKDNNDAFSVLNMIPTFDKNKTDTNMVLRGRAKYDVDQNPENELARVNYNFVDTYTRNVWSGIEYTLSDSDKSSNPNNWKGNVHKNYGNSVYHNEQNLSELDKMYLYVEVDGLNLQIMKGERVPIYIIYNNELEKSTANNFSKNDVPLDANRLYSGYYYIDSVEYEYKLSVGENANSPFTTKYILKRREWPTPEMI